MKIDKEINISKKNNHSVWQVNTILGNSVSSSLHLELGVSVSWDVDGVVFSSDLDGSFIGTDLDTWIVKCHHLVGGGDVQVLVTSELNTSHMNCFASFDNWWKINVHLHELLSCITIALVSSLLLELESSFCDFFGLLSLFILFSFSLISNLLS